MFSGNAIYFSDQHSLLLGRRIFLTPTASELWSAPKVHAIKIRVRVKVFNIVVIVVISVFLESACTAKFDSPMAASTECLRGGGGREHSEKK